MPGEDGYAFLRKLRSDNHGRPVPVAALTALAGDSDRLATAVATLAALAP